MPLLNNKPLELHKYSKKLPDNKEVFFCEYTNEIFEDYEQYCQRVIACNSLIWACAITGKKDLTFQEALESEESALKVIKDFPDELRLPLLYLASTLQCLSFNEMADKVYSFAKDRYFLGETIEAYFNDGADWVYGHILQVIPPTEEEIEEYLRERGLQTISKRPYPSSLYKYEIGELDDDAGVTEVKIFKGNKIWRTRGVYTKEKNRIYLKQFAEIKEKGFWGIQNQILNKYSVNTLKFSNLFVGETPLFETPKKISMSNGKLTQQSMKKFLISKKSPDKNKSPKDLEPVKKNGRKSSSKKAVEMLGKIQKKYEDSIDKVVQQARKDAKKEEQMAIKAKKNEEIKKKKEKERAEKAKFEDFMKEWQRKREDLECEDLKELPTPCPVDCRVPNELFGDFLMILQFFSSFHQVINVKDYFPFGLRFEVLERALVEHEIAGPLSDILQLLLVTLFNLQEQEDDQIKSTRSENWVNVNMETGGISMTEAVKLATAAASWSKQHYGAALKDLSLDSITLTEVLRLHLLASGGRAGDRSSKWRYQERGGYVSTDDPGLLFRLEEPQILRSLAIKTVAELSILEKIKIVTCLINQILTYAEVRDVIDERYEKLKTGKLELKNEQVMEAKKEKEIASQKQKERKEAMEKGQKVVEETEEERLKVEKEAKKKKLEFKKRLQDLQDVAMQTLVLPLGQDRAHRRFWVFPALPGLFVEDDERWPGSCLSEPTSKKLISIEEDTMSYVRKLFEEERLGGSDKENEGDSSLPLNSPKKKLLGESNGMARSPSPMKSPSKDDPVFQSRLLCTACRDTCFVHGKLPGRTTWSFFYTESDINELINNLNKRGFREHNLRQNLIEEMDRITASLNKCPVRQLNRFVPLLPNVHSFSYKSTRSCKGYENANLRYPSDMPVEDVLNLYIRDLILDTEEKIFLGGLGSLKVKDRVAWRSAIANRSYDKQTDTLTWPQYPRKKDTPKEEETPSRPDTPCSIGSHEGEDGDVFANMLEQKAVVRDISSAVLQLGRSVEKKFLQKPLPNDERKDKKLTAMERWEMSLMTATSFSQIYLHLDTLENSIQWERSVLNARCKVCRRSKDAENMLLCDECNRGFHLACLKPKLSAVPEGDWFCVTCRPKEPVKKTRTRRLFMEESDDDEEPRTRRRRLREDSSDEPLSKIKLEASQKGGNSTYSDEPMEEDTRSRRSKKQKGMDDSSDEPLSSLATAEEDKRSARRRSEAMKKIVEEEEQKPRRGKRVRQSDDIEDELITKHVRSSRRSLRPREEDGKEQNSKAHRRSADY